MHSVLRVGALALLCLGGASLARAQDEVDPGEAARFRVGALRFTPSIAVSNLGIDSNVFNQAENPRQDSTAAVGPAVDLWLRGGRSYLSGKAAGQYLYFKEYDNQRSWNTAFNGRWEMRLTRLTPFAIGVFNDTNERPGYEIDSRARRRDKTFGLGSDVRLSAKTSLALTAKRSDYQFDEDQRYLGVDLAEQLNRVSDTETVDLRLRLTPLTTFVVRSEAMQDRFDSEPLRNADSFTVMPGFELRPQALISGEAFVGVKQFRTFDAALPDYTGVVSNVKVRYTVAATRIALGVSRDLTYSYEVDQPYYALTDTNVEVTERITHVWDVIGRVSRQTMAYQNVSSAVTLGDRVDHSWMAGGGLGYRFGETIRVGVDVNYYRRTVDQTASGNYEGLRAGASISYGLP